MAATTILLVDDDEIIRSALRDLLSHKGFIVTVADLHHQHRHLRV
jgi:CheY-like chemotaxis protein